MLELAEKAKKKRKINLGKRAKLNALRKRLSENRQVVQVGRRYSDEKA